MEKTKGNNVFDDGKKQKAGRVVEKPTNPMVTPLLNDLYQFTMAYAYWKAGKQSERSVLVSLSLFKSQSIESLRLLSSSFIRFDLYFRKNPFGGEYTIFAGLEECIKFLANFTLTDQEIDFVRHSLPGCEVIKTKQNERSLLF